MFIHLSPLSYDSHGNFIGVETSWVLNGFDQRQGARSIWTWCIPPLTTGMATAGIGSADLSLRWSTSDDFSASVWGESRIQKMLGPKNKGTSSYEWNHTQCF